MRKPITAAAYVRSQLRHYRQFAGASDPYLAAMAKQGIRDLAAEFPVETAAAIAKEKAKAGKPKVGTAPTRKRSVIATRGTR